MAKDDLSVSIRADISEALKKMSTVEMHRLFMGLPRGSGKTSAAAAAHAFTGLRAALERDAWKFGTVHRNKLTDERVMAVGHRAVTNISSTDTGFRPWERGVTNTVEDWFDYWEVEQDT